MSKENTKKKEKATKQELIQANNLIEEVSEILEPCIKCGMCKSNCAVFKAIREETVSPRGHAILLSNKKLESSIYDCNLCKACEVTCPLDLKICDAIKKAREALALKKKNTKQNEEMIQNIRETGNPFGNKPPKGDELYCC
ncbi:(Fe-S)-binding protein [archaeon]|jgi:Fe-S oxidoreductase|nr:(Fe-S)-binding protein [archaeon]